MAGTLFANGILLLDDGFSRADLLVRDGRIGRIAPAIAPEPDDAVVDLCGDRLVPGFIDMHVHGGGGADFMDGSEGAIRTVCRTHARFGTTTLCPTTLTAPDDEIAAFLATVRGLMRGDDRDPSRRDGARVGGVHVEGPWLAPSQAGAQDPAYLRPPSVAHLERLLGSCDGVSTVTIALGEDSEEITRTITYDAAKPTAGVSAKLGVKGAVYTVSGKLANAEDGTPAGTIPVTLVITCASTKW